MSIPWLKLCVLVCRHDPPSTWEAIQPYICHQAQNKICRQHGKDDWYIYIYIYSYSTFWLWSTWDSISLIQALLHQSDCGSEFIIRIIRSIERCCCMVTSWVESKSHSAYSRPAHHCEPIPHALDCQQPACLLACFSYILWFMSKH